MCAGGNQGLSPTSVIARGKTGSFLGGLFISQLLSNMTFNWCKWMPQPTGPRALCSFVALNASALNLNYCEPIFSHPVSLPLSTKRTMTSATSKVANGMCGQTLPPGLLNSAHIRVAPSLICGCSTKTSDQLKTTQVAAETPGRESGRLER